MEIQIVVPDIAIAEKSLRNRETIGHGIFDRYKPTPSVRGGRIDQDLGVFQIESIVDKTRVEVVPSLSRHKKTDVNVAGRLGSTASVFMSACALCTLAMAAKSSAIMFFLFII